MKCKKLLTLALAGTLIFPTVSHAALANDGDTQQNQVNVSMEVTAQDLGGVTVSIPSEINVTYDSEDKVFKGTGRVSAKGYVPHYGRVNIAYEGGESKNITLRGITNQEDIKGHLVYGDMWGKSLWHEDELLAGQLNDEDKTEVPIEIKVPTSSAIKVDRYATQLTFNVSLEVRYSEETETGVRIGDTTYPYSDASYFSITKDIDPTGTRFSSISLGTNGNIGALDQATVVVPRFSDKGITLDELEGCKYSGDHGAFILWCNDPSEDFNTNVETLILNEDIRRISGKTNNVEKMYVQKNTWFAADMICMPNTDIYYCGTALDYSKNVWSNTLNIRNTATFKNYVTTNDALPTFNAVGYDGQPAYTPNVYVLDGNQNFVLLTKEMILALQ